MPQNPRQVALEILNQLDKTSLHLDHILEKFSDDVQKLSKRDRSLVNALVYGVLRWRKLLDWIILQHSSARINKIDPIILNVLRLGLFQIFYLDRIPDSAAVNTSVEIAKEIAPQWIVGFVNAVLRNASRNKAALAYPDIKKHPDTAIPIMTSFPEWLIKPWLTRFGIEETIKLCDAANSIPPLTVRANSLKTQRNELLSRLTSNAGKISPTSFSPDGIALFELATAIHEMKPFQEGLFQVQDEAAQLISYLLSPRPGEKILDACAGLGGKTGHIAQLMHNRGQLVAIDRDSKKIEKLNKEMIRLGITIVSSGIHDLEKRFPRRADGGFDRILLDAPCSGIGVIRRNPDIKWNASRQNLKRFHLHQLKLLSRVSQMLKSQGILVYSVCSFEPEENEMVVNKFLKAHKEFQICDEFGEIRFDPTPFVDGNGFFRTFPHLHNMDGFFAASLKKIR